MVKDSRYLQAGKAVEKGEIVLFKELFRYVPKTIIARSLRIKLGRFNLLLNNLEKFRLEKFFELAELMEVKEEQILNLVMRQLKVENKLSQQWSIPFSAFLGPRMAP